MCKRMIFALPLSMSLALVACAEDDGDPGNTDTGLGDGDGDGAGDGDGDGAGDGDGDGDGVPGECGIPGLVDPGPVQAITGQPAYHHTDIVGSGETLNICELAGKPIGMDHSAEW